MRVFTSNSFRGHWPVGSAAVIVAEDTEHAIKLLEEKLASIGLAQSIELDQIEEVAINGSHCVILCDGEY